MSFRDKLVHELKALGLASAYFLTFLGLLLTLKKLALAEYDIEFRGLSLALVGTLVLAKVVLILEHVSLGRWTRSRPGWVDVVLRTVLYTAGVFVVLVLEKAFEGRHEYGGFTSSLFGQLRHAKLDQVWIDTIAVSLALLGYNLLSLIRRHLGPGALLWMLRTPLPEEPGAGSNDSFAAAIDHVHGEAGSMPPPTPGKEAQR